MTLRNAILAAVGILALGGGAAVARADDFSFGFHYGGPRYYRPAYTCGPTVVRYYDYCEPVVVVRPRPVVVYNSYPVVRSYSRVYRSYGPAYYPRHYSRGSGFGFHFRYDD
ncbi:MAG: hypothetical protein HRF50_00770 [Phycisphaerae bacterium]|jgi:hypothetical protein